MPESPLLLRSRRDTVRLGRAIGKALQPGDLVLLSGDLGAGKTFLARSIVRALGVTSQSRVGSPTFSLVHEYVSPRGLVLHADLYRLRDGALSFDLEVERLGLVEPRNEGAVLLVEWGDSAEGALGGNVSLRVCLSPLAAPNQREATVVGPRAVEVLPA